MARWLAVVVMGLVLSWPVVIGPACAADASNSPGGPSLKTTLEKGLKARIDKEVSLDNFDSIELIVHPGQEWYPCGDLAFLNGKVETFRLLGVKNPEPFRQTCLKTQRGHAGVKKATAVKKK